MPVPKRRTSTARQGKRRASIHLVKPTLVNCKNCGEKKISRQTCPHCNQR